MTKEDKLLAWIARVPSGVLETQIVGSGYSKTLNNLLVAGKVDLTAHPTVKDRSGVPACAAVLKAPPKA